MSAGIHHITAICRDARRNVAFYTGTLGLRTVKKTVNFDVPTTWHLYYGDQVGSPGTALTFFVWPDRPQGSEGVGMAVEPSFIVPLSAMDYWTQRLAQLEGHHGTPERRFDRAMLTFADPDGMRLALVGVDGAEMMPGWSNGDVQPEHAVRGFHGVTLQVADVAATAPVLDVLGFRPDGRDGERRRFLSTGAPPGATVDILKTPSGGAGRQGWSSIHHVAFRAADETAQTEMMLAIKALGLRPTDPIDRCYFRSVYFREPGGILFEIATDRPGFTFDETEEALGTALKLPPWHEPKRAEIVEKLPPLE